MQKINIRKTKTISVLVTWLIALLAGHIAGTGDYASAAPAQQEELCALPYQSVSLPLPELAGMEYIRMDGEATGFTGGLYPDGNQPPQEHLDTGLELASQIVPLDQEGNPDPQDGRLVMMSIGMSNTAIEFGAFSQLARQDPRVNSQVSLLNGAISGATSDRWLSLDSIAWRELDRQMDNSPFTPEMVQAAWIKLTQVQGGNFPEKAQSLQSDLQTIVQLMHEKFPNLKIVYLSSRTYSYTYWRGLSPEPVAFETGFAVKWLIEGQINGDPQLNYDPDNGEVMAPYLTWGPYLWINGETPRVDGRVWLQTDLRGDCTHPSESGSAKVAEMMLEFFHEDPTSQVWFSGSTAMEPTQTDTAAPTNTPIPTETELPTETFAPTETEEPILTETERTIDDTPTPASVAALPATNQVEAIPPDETSAQPADTVAPLWPWLVGGGLLVVIVAAVLRIRQRSGS